MTQISILMPVYNAEPFLRACLDSIVNQSFKDWELLAVDDGSSDQSLHLLEDYAKQHDRIQVLTNPSKGIIAALRHAHTHCTGTYITRMDADDLMPPNKLDNLISLALKHGPQKVFTGKVSYFREGEEIGDGFKRYEAWLNRLVDNKTWWSDLYRECPIASPNWLMHKDDLAQIKAFEPNDYPEDYDLVFRMAHAQLEVIASFAVTHLWRDHSSRVSRTSDVYADHAFIDIKWRWFQQITWQSNAQLVLWGAGKKGKRLAALINESGKDFTWITDNKKKQGHIIHNNALQSRAALRQDIPVQIIMALGNLDEQRDLETSLSAHLACSFYPFS